MKVGLAGSARWRAAPARLRLALGVRWASPTISLDVQCPLLGAQRRAFCLELLAASLVCRYASSCAAFDLPERRKGPLRVRMARRASVLALILLARRHAATAARNGATGRLVQADTPSTRRAHYDTIRLRQTGEGGLGKRDHNTARLTRSAPPASSLYLAAAPSSGSPTPDHRGLSSHTSAPGPAS